jgi:hypothetical protein
MATTSLLTLLLSVDDPIETEAPSGFHWQREVDALRVLVPELEAACGRRFDVDASAQDASFFADLIAPGQDAFTLRFSSFGHLFTSWCHDTADERESGGAVAWAIAALEKKGYRYVSAGELNIPYTGKNPHLQGITWWLRYFDYL